MGKPAVRREQRTPPLDSAPAPAQLSSQNSEVAAATQGEVWLDDVECCPSGRVLSLDLPLGTFGGSSVLF